MWVSRSQGRPNRYCCGMCNDQDDISVGVKIQPQYNKSVLRSAEFLVSAYLTIRMPLARWENIKQDKNLTKEKIYKDTAYIHIH